MTPYSSDNVHYSANVILQSSPGLGYKCFCIDPHDINMAALKKDSLFPLIHLPCLFLQEDKCYLAGTNVD